MAMFSAGGKIYSGNNITTINNKVYIDGVLQTDISVENNTLEIRVLEGVIQNIKADGSVTALNVTGNVNAGGSVDCKDVGGSVSAGGSIRSAKVAGSASAGGSIRIG